MFQKARVIKIFHLLLSHDKNKSWVSHRTMKCVTLHKRWNGTPVSQTARIFQLCNTVCIANCKKNDENIALTKTPVKYNGKNKRNKDNSSKQNKDYNSNKHSNKTNKQETIINFSVSWPYLNILHFQNLPGQLLRQYSSSELCPLQRWPPNVGAGLVQFLCLLLIPRPWP